MNYLLWDKQLGQELLIFLKIKYIIKKDDSIEFINEIGKSIKSIDTPKVNIKVEGEQLPSIVKYLSALAKKE